MSIPSRTPRPDPVFSTLGVTCVALALACSSSDGNKSDGGDDGSSSGTTTSDGPSGGSGSSETTSDDSTTSSGGSATDSSGGSGGTPGTGGNGTVDGAGGGAGAGGDCPVEIESHALEVGYHLEECSFIDYSSNPPCTGEHYPVWAAYQTYDFAVPRGYWVHSLEHGAIVISYNCEDGCPDEVAQVQAMIDGLPADLRCSGTGIDVQVILTPDPLLDVRWGLSSWGNTLRSDCVNVEAFEGFYFDHLGRAPEDICGGGAVLAEETLTAGCGE